MGGVKVASGNECVRTREVLPNQIQASDLNGATDSGESENVEKKQLG